MVTLPRSQQRSEPVAMWKSEGKTRAKRESILTARSCNDMRNLWENHQITHDTSSTGNRDRRQQIPRSWKIRIPPYVSQTIHAHVITPRLARTYPRTRPRLTRVGKTSVDFYGRWGWGYVGGTYLPSCGVSSCGEHFGCADAGVWWVRRNGRQQLSPYDTTYSSQRHPLPMSGVHPLGSPCVFWTSRNAIVMSWRKGVLLGAAGAAGAARAEQKKRGPRKPGAEKNVAHPVQLSTKFSCV